MNLDFTAAETIAHQVRRFAQHHLAAGALKRPHDPRFPYDVAQLMAKQGLMGITLPERDCGGQGGSLMDAVIAIEHVAAICPRIEPPQEILGRKIVVVRFD
jgi:alkylation response protein AidB-like acyl-CoA dehydrogenase